MNIEQRYCKQALLDVVKQSPAAVKAHDRRAWLSLFAADNRVDDPYGAKPHISRQKDKYDGRWQAGDNQQALGRFYDTFIAPNEIHFDVQRDIVSDHYVLRDLTIKTRVSETITLYVPMHLLYQLVEEDGELRIAWLIAYWQLWPMIKQLLQHRMAALPVLVSLSWRMVRFQGIMGVYGFLQAFRDIGEHGRRSVLVFTEAVNGQYNDQCVSEVIDLLNNANQMVSLPVSPQQCTPQQLLEQTSIKLTVNKLLVAGYAVSCSVELKQGDVFYAGIAIFDFHQHNKKIDKIRFYWDM